MPPIIPLFASILFFIFIFRADVKRRPSLSPALIWPVLWYTIAASKPLGVWLWIWGVPLPGGSSDPTEGSMIDRWFYSTLIVIGFYILDRRQCLWNKIVRENRWLFICLFFMVLSVGWSDYPSVSIKRVIMSLGDIVMALVVLTEKNVVEAISAVLRRCVYLHIPMSIIPIRYFRHLGIQWDWSGAKGSWIGIATSKNTLGQIAAVSAIIFIMDRMLVGNVKEGRVVDFIYILMSLYLLKGSDDSISMTSVSMFFICFLVLLSLNYMRSSISKITAFFALVFSSISALLLLVIVHTFTPFSDDSLFGVIITTFGRDLTLTGRTEIWSDVLHIAAQSPILGVGFGAFWIGRLANIPWNQDMTWVLAQAHNGYVDTYLQLGVVGVFLLFGFVISIIPSILRTIRTDFQYGRFRAIFFLMIVYVNITESTFLRGGHNLWFLFLLVALNIPGARHNLLAQPIEGVDLSAQSMKQSQ